MAYFWVYPNSGSWSQITWTILLNVHLISKYLLPEKISLLSSLQADIRWGSLVRLAKPFKGFKYIRIQILPTPEFCTFLSSQNDLGLKNIILTGSGLTPPHTIFTKKNILWFTQTNKN